MPKDSSGLGTYKDALTSARIAIFRESCSEDNRRRVELYSGRTGKDASWDSYRRTNTSEVL
jgi:hypothetical protein